MTIQAPTEIHPGLWQGGLPEDWFEAWERFDVVVSLCAGPRVIPLPPRRLRVLWYIDDWTVPEDLGQLWRLVRFVAGEVGAGKRVLVHCAAGLNRSGFVAALVYRELVECSGTEAEDRVKALRPGSLLNPYYVAFLHRLDGIIDEASTTLGGAE